MSWIDTPRLLAPAPLLGFSVKSPTAEPTPPPTPPPPNPLSPLCRAKRPFSDEHALIRPWIMSQAFCSKGFLNPPKIKHSSFQNHYVHDMMLGIQLGDTLQYSYSYQGSFELIVSTVTIPLFFEQEYSIRPQSRILRQHGHFSTLGISFLVLWSLSLSCLHV